jgi:glycosyltransferase involved in cell wall biosynthesis
MKIVSIVPGFGGTFYCGNCLRDSGLTGALRKAGQDAVILPVYLPLTIAGDVQDTPVFYGAVNIYLKQMMPALRNLPSWAEKLLNSRPLLKLAAAKSGSTRAGGLEDLTESMLLGEEGRQARELEELVNFLKHHEKPDIVHFSNALLIGMAARIRQELSVPVVCSLQDEDVWIDAMHPHRRQPMWDLMAEKAKDIDAFIAVSHYFAGQMKEKMKLDPGRLHVVPIGINPGDYDCGSPDTSPPAIGYLSRICEENGFGILVDAFIQLVKSGRSPGLQLHFTGGMTGDDKVFLKKQMKKLKEVQVIKDEGRRTKDEVSNKTTLTSITNPESRISDPGSRIPNPASSIQHPGSVFFYPDFSPGALKGFFSRLSVLSVPVLRGEAFGLYQLESLASGVPIVQPALGAFPEVIEATGGGILYRPNEPSALAEALDKVLGNPQSLQKMAEAGRKAVEEKFDCVKLTGKLLDIYTSLR